MYALLLSLLLSCVLRGSLNDPEGGDRNGGGKGLGALLANNPMPVWNRYGSLGKTEGSSLPCLSRSGKRSFCPGGEADRVIAGEDEDEGEEDEEGSVDNCCFHS